MRQHTIGPVSSGLGEGLAGGDVLVPSRFSNTCGGPGAMHADTVERSSTAWLGCVSEDARLSTFASLEFVRELQRRDKTVTTNWIPLNWGEKGLKKGIIRFYKKTHEFDRWNVFSS